MDQFENDFKDKIVKDSSKKDYPMKLLLSLAKEVREDIRTNIKIAKFLLYKRKVGDHVWLNTFETLNLLKISRRTLERYRQRGFIRYYLIRGHCRYLKEDVLALLAKQTR